VKQESLFKWTAEDTDKFSSRLVTPYLVYKQDKNFSYHFSAFTVAELGEMLMMLPERNKDGELQHIEYYNTQCNDTVDCDCGGTQNFHVKYILPSKKKDLERSKEREQVANRSRRTS